jgi:hypothetical protein
MSSRNIFHCITLVTLHKDVKGTLLLSKFKRDILCVHLLTETNDTLKMRLYDRFISIQSHYIIYYVWMILVERHKYIYSYWFNVELQELKELN